MYIKGYSDIGFVLLEFTHWRLMYYGSDEVILDQALTFGRLAYGVSSVYCLQSVLGYTEGIYAIMVLTLYKYKGKGGVWLLMEKC